MCVEVFSGSLLALDFNVVIFLGYNPLGIEGLSCLYGVQNAGWTQHNLILLLVEGDDFPPLLPANNKPKVCDHRCLSIKK